MIIVISPAKSLKSIPKANYKKYSKPFFIKEIGELSNSLSKLKSEEIASLMKISDKLSTLNHGRYKILSDNFNKIDENNSIQALLTFDGDVYQEIDVENFSDKNFQFAQEHLFILSGLYGILKPLDLILPYRLEMGTNFKNSQIEKLLKIRNLYDFWQEKISKYLNKTSGNFLINLASEEYFQSVNPSKLDKKIINIIFKKNKDGNLKIIGSLAKRARGMMANFIIKNEVTNPQDLKKFNEKNYKFREDLSDENNFIFVN